VSSKTSMIAEDMSSFAESSECCPCTFRSDGCPCW